MRSMVEGAQLRRQSHDRILDLLDPAGDVDRGDAQHGNASLPQPCVSSRIALRPISQVMAHPIDLDGQARLGAIEVEHIRAERVLTAEDGRSGRALA